MPFNSTPHLQHLYEETVTPVQVLSLSLRYVGVLTVSLCVCDVLPVFLSVTLLLDNVLVRRTQEQNYFRRYVRLQNGAAKPWRRMDLHRYLWMVQQLLTLF